MNLNKTTKRLRISRSKKAGLIFPVTRIQRYLKKRIVRQRIPANSAVYVAAVLEYLTAEMVELSGEAARMNRKIRILPRHIFLAIANDEELHKVLSNTIIPGGGTMPFLHPSLVPAKTKSRTAKDKSSEKAHKLQDLFASPARSQKELRESLHRNYAKSPVLNEKGDLVSHFEVMNSELSVFNFEDELESEAELSRKQCNDVIVSTGDYEIVLERTLTLYSITIIKGNIFKIPADAIINLVNSDLYMTSRIGKLLEKRGGQVFKNIINKMRMETAPLEHSDAIVSRAVNTSARFIIHCSVSCFDNDNEESQLKKSITNCLNLASNNEMKVLILPLFVNDKSKHSMRKIAKINIDAINSYFFTTSKTSLFHLNLVPFDAESLKDIQDEVCRL